MLNSSGTLNGGDEWGFSPPKDMPSPDVAEFFLNHVEIHTFARGRVSRMDPVHPKVRQCAPPERSRASAIISASST